MGLGLRGGGFRNGFRVQGLRVKVTRFSKDSSTGIMRRTSLAPELQSKPAPQTLNPKP